MNRGKEFLYQSTSSDYDSSMSPRGSSFTSPRSRGRRRRAGQSSSNSIPSSVRDQFARVVYAIDAG